MSALHIEDDLLDQYALGSVRQELLPSLEEHLLVCQHCQTRLIEADEFVDLVRAAATQPDARPEPHWKRLIHPRVLTWTAAAVTLAAAFSLVSVEFRKSPVMPATVLMQALRGPEDGTAISARKPARLVFDLTPSGPAADYRVQIVNLLGAQVLAVPAEFQNGHLSLQIDNLQAGSYWVRIYRGANSDLIAEYGLRAE